MTSQVLPMEDVLTTLKEKTKNIRNKGKLSTYKLLYDIEATKNLKGVFEEHIFNAKFEFTLKEILDITKKEFDDIIIDNIKWKRQLKGEVGLNHVIDACICKDEEDKFDNYCKQSTSKEKIHNQRVCFDN